jgi:type IV pilus assembly protein PilP
MRPRTVRVFPFLAAWLIAVAGMTGCAKEGTPPPPTVQKPVPKAAAVKPAEGVPADAPGEAAALAVVPYNPKGKRDPLLPFLKEETKSARGSLDKVPPLQRYDLGELKLVGVMWESRGYRALVEDAEGKGYSVTVGTRIGRDGGVVSRITRDEVIVKNVHRDSGGARSKRTSSLKLQTAGGR